MRSREDFFVFEDGRNLNRFICYGESVSGEEVVEIMKNRADQLGCTSQDEPGSHSEGISLSQGATVGVKAKYLGIWNQLKGKAQEFLHFTQHI